MILILRRHLKVFSRTWWTNVMFNFLEPFLYLFAMGFGLGAYVEQIDGMSYAQYIAPGFVASSGMWAATFECTYGSFIRCEFQKTFHAMLAAPLTVRDVVWGEALYAAIKSVIFGTVILIVIGLLGLVQSWWALIIPLFLAIPALAFALLALSYTGTIHNIDYFNYYITLVSTPLYLFSGIFFPLNSLPAWGIVVAWLNPLYHSVEICRALVLGNPEPGLLLHAAVLVLFIVLLCWLPERLLKKRLIS